MAESRLDKLRRMKKKAAGEPNATQGGGGKGFLTFKSIRHVRDTDVNTFSSGGTP